MDGATRPKWIYLEKLDLINDLIHAVQCDRTDVCESSVSAGNQQQDVSGYIRCA